MENKESHLDVASMSLSQLELMLQKYKAELEFLNPSEKRRKWLVARIREIDDEIKRRFPSSIAVGEYIYASDAVEVGTQSEPFGRGQAMKLFLIGAAIPVCILAGMLLGWVEFILLWVVGGSIVLVGIYVAIHDTTHDEIKSIKVTIFCAILLLLAFVGNVVWRGVEVVNGKRYFELSCVCFAYIPEEAARVERENNYRFLQYTRLGGEVVGDVVYNEKNEPMGAVKIRVRVEPGSFLTTGLYIRHVVQESTKSAQSLFKRFPDLEQVTYVIYGHGYSAFGEYVEGDIAYVRFERSWAMRIKVDNLSVDELHKLLLSLGALRWIVSPKD
jgi:hypothetical protein